MIWLKILNQRANSSHNLIKIEFLFKFKPSRETKWASESYVTPITKLQRKDPKGFNFNKQNKK